MSIDATAAIHPSSVIEEGAQVGPNCKVGPFCLVGANVRLGEDVELISHVVVAGNTSIGAETRVWPFASIGHQPQDLKYRGEKTYLEIGERCMLRESISISPGTAGGTGLTKIGNNCLMMLGSHVGHDCVIGNNVVLANHSSVAGHVEIGDDVILGALSGIHQFVKVGKGAIVGGLAAVVNDIIPYGLAVSERAHLTGVNLIGLKRKGFDKSVINEVRSAFDDIFIGEGTLKDRARKSKESYSDNPLTKEIIDFLLADTSRSFLTPKSDD